MNSFFNLNLSKSFDELRVVEVIKFCLFFGFFSNFSIKGIILIISPTLDPCNHINLPFPSFF